MDQNENELESLENLAARSSDLELLKATPSEFNVFEAMGVVFQEARHSDFLAFLLDPQGNHRLGCRFAKGWLKRVTLSARSNAQAHNAPAAPLIDPNIFNGIDLSGARVFREQDRIDVLLMDPNNRLAVVVENKIFSAEHSDQLARYRRVVEERYPGFDLLCIFLTPDGQAPSHRGYVPADYRSVCDEVESIVKESTLPSGTPVDSEVLVALIHYAGMVRRNIVVRSEVTDLARRLYLTHRTAFDLVYAHRFSHQKRLRGTLINLIKDTPGLSFDGKTGNPPEEWVFFHLDEWDVPALRHAREDYRNNAPILSLVFDNYLDSLDLKLEFGPGDTKVRHRLLEMAHADPDLFAVAPPLPNPEWVTTIWRMPLLAREEYLEGADSDRERLVRKRWNTFLREVLPRLSDAVRQQEWIWDANAEA